MRWNDSITLLSPAEAYQDASGTWHEGDRVPREVMCNARSIGLVTAAKLVDVGLRNAVQVEVRSLDYEDEDQAIYHGKEMEIVTVSGGGETCHLTLSRKVGNEESEEDSE